MLLKALAGRDKGPSGWVPFSQRDEAEMTYAGEGVAALHHFAQDGLPAGEAAALLQAVDQAVNVLAAHASSFHSTNLDLAMRQLVAAKEAAETAQQMIHACQEAISSAVIGFAGGG
jgi:hypothetical protein